MFTKPNPSARSGQRVLDEDQAKSSIEKVILILRAHTGHDFSLYKKTTIHRRIERRIGLHHMDNMAAYVRFLRENPQEVELLFNELLIGVTNFFRDPAASTTSDYTCAGSLNGASGPTRQRSGSPILA